ncbi:hypothetical protein [Motilimonas pumila]|uniref:hypothetical protein n=1 Tax=Motilimonas pumila TaxID=2303987 RepID=UPI001314E556|nr:hypothetical protein [Motilimonas pumila]
MQAYLAAIDVLMCHCGVTFEQACDQLGINLNEVTETDDREKLLSVSLDQK